MKARTRRTTRWFPALSLIGLIAGWSPALAQDKPASPPAPATPAADGYLKPALFTAQTIDETWRDDARNRDVPVRIYLPKAKGGGMAVAVKFPVVVFSHGLGGSGHNYGYFGENLASHGYIVIAPSHAGSDTAALLQWIKDHPDDKDKKAGRGWLSESVNDPDNLKNRPKDISFVIDQIGLRPTVSGIADPSRIGVAGHSFGAYTAMAIGGMLVDLPDAKDSSFFDKRVKAVLPMSPEGKGTMGIDADSWSRFAVPVLFLTGTKDYGAGGLAASWRQEAFAAIHGQDAYLATIDGATHMTFSGMGADANEGGDRGAVREKIRERIHDKIDDKGLAAPDPDEAAHLDIIRPLSLAFFDAYLNDDPEAKSWLAKYFAARHGDVRAEFRPASAK